MARQVFYSFHYKPDCQRASQVRNAGVVEGNPPASDNDWEAVTRGGDAVIKKWINDQLSGRSCTVVLVGAGTAGRKWITHEIIESWNQKKGVVGVHIHKLKNLSGEQSTKGGNPFDEVTFGSGKLSSVVKLYDPTGWDSKDVYATIKASLASWIEEAISIRQKN